MPAMEEELSPAILAARERLRQRCSSTQQLGGKGTARRKGRKQHKAVVADDKKLQLTLKRLGAAAIYGVEEVYLMKADGSALHFSNPKVQAAPAANTYIVAGAAEEKQNAAAMLGARNLLLGGAAAAAAGLDAAAFNPEMLRQFQQQVQQLSKDKQDAAQQQQQQQQQDAADDVPDLVENFEEASKQ